MTEAIAHENKAAAVDSLLTEPAKTEVTAGAKPEGLPDEFWDSENNAPVFDKLLDDWHRKSKIAKDLRVKLSKGEFEGGAPDDIKEYQLTLDEKLAPLVKDDDQVLNAFRESAKKAGIPKDKFNEMTVPVIAKLAELHEQMNKQPTEEELKAMEEQAKKEEQEFIKAEIGKLGEGGPAIIQSIGSFINEMKAQGKFDDETAEAAKRMVYDSATARAMNIIRAELNSKGVSKGIEVEAKEGSGLSKQAILDKMAEAMINNNEEDYNKYKAMLAN